jgi:hypothetical protein
LARSRKRRDTVNLQPNLLPLGKRTRDNFDMMDKQTRRGFLGISDSGGAVIPANRANITSLSTRLTIKWGLIDNQPPFANFANFFDFGIAINKRGNNGFG